MGIFNRKLLVLLIFINYFNNIYIFCDNGVEVEEIGDLQSAKGSHQPIDSFINDYKNTQESDDESTQESGGNINKSTRKSHGDSTQESDGESPIDGDKDQIIDPTKSSPIIKKEQDQDKEAGKITNWIKKNKILFSCLLIATLIGGFFGIKSLVQGLSGKKNEREGDKMAGGMGEDNMLRDNQILKQGAAEAAAELKRKQEKEAAEEEPTAEKTRREKELLKEIITVCDLNKEALDRELKLIDNREELLNLLTEYNIEGLKVELPTIKYFNEVIEKNQNLINLINTPFNNVNGEWQACQNKTVPTGSEGFLWRENSFIINQQDQKRINNQFTYDKKSYKTYINNNKTIIAVNDKTNIIEQVVNFEQKFFIRLDGDNIIIHFDNFKFQLNTFKDNQYLDFMQFMKKEEYPLGTYYKLLHNNYSLFFIFFNQYQLKNKIIINIDEKFIILKQQIGKRFKEIYEEISKR